MPTAHATHWDLAGLWPGWGVSSRMLLGTTAATALFLRG